MPGKSPSPGVPAQVLASLGSPSQLQTPFGTMEFFDGVPTPETVALSYDALDLLRGVDVFLNCVPGASMLAMRNGLRSVGARSNVIACTTRAAHRHRWCSRRTPRPPTAPRSWI